MDATEAAAELSTSLPNPNTTNLMADGTSAPALDPPSPELKTSPKAPSLRTSFDASTSNVTPSSAPLGAIQAARRPGPVPSRASGLTSDIQAKMKAFSLSRQHAPNSAGGIRPGMPSHPAASTGNIQQGGLVGGPVLGGVGATPASPSNGGVGALRLPAGMARPNPAAWTSTPSLGPGGSPRVMNPKPVMGGLAAKRGLKPGGMKLSDATRPAESSADGSSPAADAGKTGSQFTNFANIVDTKTGTLNFQDKAVIHGGGINFSTGTNFSISLDEIDTIDELGKGNYGTVFKVRHARPALRRPGLGLRGNMQRQSSSSVASTDSESSPLSAASTPGTSGVVMAMKEIRLELEDSKFAQIIMELDILHRCRSPFIIDFYGGFFQEGSVYICMEHMDGGSVDKLYGDGIPEGVLRKITLSTVMGLKYLKDEHNIIHRDVKPTNVLVNTRGQVKICDFGVSGNLVASIAKTNIGCQSYMAPERISGGGISQTGASGGTYSVQSDIWSLGLTIIECALGRYPYPPETYDNIFSQLSAIVDGEPPDLPSDTFSEAAHNFVHSCLHKVPKMRPSYALLLRHAWLAPLMKPPTISEDEEAEAAAEAGGDAAGVVEPGAETADGEVADWVKTALERKAAGKMATREQPALHAVALDQVPGSPLLDGHGALGEQESEVPAAHAGVRVDSPELKKAKIEGVDFAADAIPNDETVEGEE